MKTRKHTREQHLNISENNGITFKKPEKNSCEIGELQK